MSTNYKMELNYFWITEFSTICLYFVLCDVKQQIIILGLVFNFKKFGEIRYCALKLTEESCGSFNLTRLK